MDLTKVALKRPISCLMLILALIIFGTSSVFTFKMELTPNLNMPYLGVATTYPGADPESVEELVTKPVEDCGETLTGLKRTMSQSSEGYSFVVFQFNYGADTKEIRENLRTALEAAMDKMPDSVKRPTINELSMTDNSTVMGISAIEVGDIDLFNVVKQDIVPQLETVSGVSEVSVFGGREKYIQIRLKPQMMKQYGLTMESLSEVISKADFTVPAGSIDQKEQTVSVVVGADYDTVQMLRSLSITTGTGKALHLSEVADISETNKKATSYSRYDGLDNVGITIKKNQSYGTVNVCADVKRKLEQIAEANPAIQFEISNDASESIEDSLHSVAETLVIGVILSMAVLFIFFGDIKASLIVGSSIPVSLLMTLILMSFSGFTLNVVTMGALVIAIGMMVDNAIVVVESCFRSYETGIGFFQAAMQGTKEVTASVIAGTATTVVVYLPIAAMSGLVGQMFSQLCWTIVYAMGASLLAALTLVPLFYAIFRPVEKTDIPVNRFLDWFRKWYEPMLHWLLHKKILVSLCTIGALVLAVLAASTLNMELMPSSDSGIVDIDVTFRSGTKLEKKNELMTQLEQMAFEDEDVEHVTVSVGESNSLSLKLKKDKNIKTIDKVEDWIEKTADLTDVDINISGSGGGMMGMTNESEMGVQIQGHDSQAVKKDALRLQAELRKLPGIVNVVTEAQEVITQARIVVDPLKASNFGLTPIGVGNSLAHVIDGLESCKITREGKEYEIRLEYPEGLYNNLNSLMDVEITAPSGVHVPLRDIGKISYVDVLENMYRMDGYSNVELYAYMLPSTHFETEKAIDDYVDNQFEFTEGVFKPLTLEDEMQEEEMGALFKAILAAVFLVFMVMAIQFESPLFSGMVMTCIPMALIGSFFLMFAVGATFSLPAAMGFLMLMGIVVNDGILFVDTANMLRQEMPLEDALVKSASIRIRPILITTLTTVLSMIPMAMGIGKNSQIMQGMALVIIGGLSASTLLTLVVLPDFYLMLDKISSLWKGLKDKKKAQQEAQQEAQQLEAELREIELPEIELPETEEPDAQKEETKEQDTPRD